MVAANVQAAKFLLEKKIPALYRVHEPPEGAKLEDLKSFLGEVGLQLGGGKKPQPEHFAKLIEAVKGRDDQRLIQEVLLRAQSMAVYRAENLGHFGLALDAYAHFTSPIRRYPDLLVHRAIHYALKEGPAGEYLYAHRDMQAHGLHTSLTERSAEKAARDVQNWFKCAYMQRHVGDTFEGTITGVQPFGLFVELDDILVSGLVHVTALRNDYYHFDPISHRLTGERSGVEFRLADRVKVQVARVDLDDRKVDFELVGGHKHRAGSEGAKPPRRKKRSKS
jgi:ribonuclease R